MTDIFLIQSQCYWIYVDNVDDVEISNLIFNRGNPLEELKLVQSVERYGNYLKARGELF